MAERPPLVRMAAALRDLAQALDDLTQHPAAAQPPATPRPSTRDRLRSVRTTDTDRQRARALLAGSGLLPEDEDE